MKTNSIILNLGSILLFTFLSVGAYSQKNIKKEIVNPVVNGQVDSLYQLYQNVKILETQLTYVKEKGEIYTTIISTQTGIFTVITTGFLALFGSLFAYFTARNFNLKKKELEDKFTLELQKQAQEFQKKLNDLKSLEIDLYHTAAQTNVLIADDANTKGFLSSEFQCTFKAAYYFFKANNDEGALTNMEDALKLLKNLVSKNNKGDINFLSSRKDIISGNIKDMMQSENAGFIESLIELKSVLLQKVFI